VSNERKTPPPLPSSKGTEHFSKCVPSITRLPPPFTLAHTPPPFPLSASHSLTSPPIISTSSPYPTNPQQITPFPEVLAMEEKFVSVKVNESEEEDEEIGKEEEEKEVEEDKEEEKKKREEDESVKDERRQEVRITDPEERITSGFERVSGRA
jgi:hypothetical protein